MRFADPEYLLCLPIVAAYLWVRWPRPARLPGTYVALPVFSYLEPGRGARASFACLPVALRAVSLALVVLALARPQAATAGEPLRGRNLVIALDVSSSMRAEDFRPHNRLHVAKDLLGRFVRGREGDLVGLVVFAGKAFTQTPLTTDPGLVVQMLRRAEVGMLPDGTAIGTALATGLDHVSELPPGASAIVLVTDGVNNAGRVSPLTAAEAARALGVRVYTIGVSAPKAGFVQAWKPARLRDRQTISPIEEETLRRIARRTGGRYYRAADPRALSRVLRDIDGLESAEIELPPLTGADELYVLFLAPALACFALAFALRATWLRTLP